MAGGSVVRYEGKRGTVFRIKYRDANGRQVQETLGGASEGWTQRKAQQALRNKLADVDRDRFVKPEKLTFATFAERYLTEYLPSRNLKYSTLQSYRQTINGHLAPAFGSVELTVLEHRPDLLDAFIAKQTQAGLAPKTIRNQLLTMNGLLKRAIAWKLIRQNPLTAVEAPRLSQPEMTVLTEAEIAQLTGAFSDLASAEQDPTRRQWWVLTEGLVVIALATALRRGEILGLRWRDVDTDNRLLHVREALVLGRVTTPKSRTSRRTIELGPYATEVLESLRALSPYTAADDFVFAHPQRGSALDPSRISREFIRPALRAAGITRPFRPFHDLRHTAITHEAAAGNPQAYIQMKAGHSHGSITERYIHAAQVMFPGAAARAEGRLFGRADHDGSSAREVPSG